MYVTGEWRTPRGRPAIFSYRQDTSDWNTVSSILTHDEYRLRELTLTGVALDIGAHVGACAIALLLDNPDLRVVAVEPVPDNVTLIGINAEHNGVTDRLTVFDGAACGTGDRTATVWYGYTGTESLEHHAFIGNSTLAYETPGEAPHETREAPCTNLAELVKEHGSFSFAKLDCEGCEYAFLDCGCARHIERIYGEFHPTKGQGKADIERILGLSHEVTFSGDHENIGAFWAVRR